MENKENKKDLCLKHEFTPLGFEVVEKNHKKIETIAAIMCRHCGMFRTKILTFHREILSD
jgi:hypothetical protein